MAETPSQPPGWPFDEQPPETTVPPAAPPPAPPFEPPAHPAPPVDPATYAPPPAAPQPGYQPPPPQPGYAPPPAAPQPGYQAPPPAATPYEPPMPGQPPHAPNQQVQPPPPPNYGVHQEWGGPPPLPPKRSKKPIWITLGVIFGVIVLAIGSCTVWFVSTVKAPVDESNRFLAEIDRGDYRAAANMTDPGCNAGMTASDLNDLFLNADIDYNLNNSSITNSRAEVSGSFSSPSLPFSRVEVRLSDLSGDWRVCGLRLD